MGNGRVAENAQVVFGDRWEGVITVISSCDEFVQSRVGHVIVKLRERGCERRTCHCVGES
jgi:hypothetical protein